MALIQAEHWAFALIAVLASVLTLWYYLLIQRQAFFGKLNEQLAGGPGSAFLDDRVHGPPGARCASPSGIFFAGTVNSWVRPAADALSQGLQALLGSLRILRQ